jgi:hypothetical protein
MQGANAEQQIAAATLADRAGQRAHVRVLDDGVLEVAVKGSNGTDVHAIDVRGRASFVRLIPSEHGDFRPAGTIVFALACFGGAIWIGHGWLTVAFACAGVVMLVAAFAVVYSRVKTLPPYEWTDWSKLRTDEPGD